MKLLLLSMFALAITAGTPVAQEPEQHPIAKAVAAQLSAPKKKFTMVVELKLKEGGAEKLIAAFGEAVELVRKEEGCLRYELNQDAADANTFVVYERWGSIAKLEAHLVQPHTKALMEKVMPLLDGEPKIRVMTPKADPVKPKKPEVK